VITRKQATTKLQVEYRAVGQIKPSKSNSRAHSPAQIDAIRRSIDAVGWTKPIIIDERGEILAGHGAYQAALQGGEAQVPTITRTGLSAAQKRAYRIADNKLAEQSTWDTNILVGELADLAKMGYDLGLTGFDQGEIEFLLAPPKGRMQEPEAGPTVTNPVSRLGDLWHLGDHRLICGDSTKAATYKILMAGRQAQCVFTDPPYGVSYQAEGPFAAAVIKGDDKRRGQLKRMLQDAFGHAMKHAREDAGWYIWHAAFTREDFAQAMRDAGLVEMQALIWEKAGGVMGWSDYRWAHEPCFYAARQGVRPTFHGDRTNTTIWHLQFNGPADEATSIGNGVIVTTGSDGQELYITTTPPKGKKLRHLHAEPGKPILLQARADTDDIWKVGRDEGGDWHPTSKPVELVRRALVNSTLEGEIVLDMFSGGASTIMGAEQTNRVGYAIELDPQYVDAGVLRWQKTTGKEALHAEGKTFAAITKARRKG